ncbi:hypothetical protein ACU4GD_36970 [Cupriavidus basilensis]
MVLDRAVKGYNGNAGSIDVISVAAACRRERD